MYPTTPSPNLSITPFPYATFIQAMPCPVHARRPGGVGHDLLGRASAIGKADRDAQPEPGLVAEHLAGIVVGGEGRRGCLGDISPCHAVDRLLPLVAECAKPVRVGDRRRIEDRKRVV